MTQPSPTSDKARSNSRSFQAILLAAYTLGLCALGTCPVASTLAHAASDPKLIRDARSILSNRCFACHGPDEAKVESGLRLDQHASATSPSDSGQIAIVPGDPLQSELLRRIQSTDDGDRMPPPHFAKALSQDEVRTLTQWIQSGATFSQHWSFLPPQPIPIPTPSTLADWATQPIDHFILAKLLDRQLAPSPEADRPSLIRRLSFDLTGLPPTLQELDHFLNDNAPLAYERLVDRLLASPAFGEHWGKKWLDLARYADSAGYADDPARTIWAYRDWVIRNWNQNTPFDRFTRDQLAGDLLPNPSTDQLVATAFHRNTLTNNEGGTNDEEFRNVAVVDRVNTTMAVWMGLTMACAQCHSHKYDPISQHEYFRLFAIFNQSQDADRSDESPRLDLFSDSQLEQQQLWKSQIHSLESLLNSPNPSLATEQSNWEKELLQPIEWSTSPPNSATTDSNSTPHIQSTPNSTTILHPPYRIALDSSADQDTIHLTWDLPPTLHPQSIHLLECLTLPDPALPNGGAGLGNGNFVLSEVTGEWVPSPSSQLEAQFLRIELPGPNRILSLAEVQCFHQGRNLAPLGSATQSSTDYLGDPSRAIDGNPDGLYASNSTTHTANESNPWWELNLGQSSPIDYITIHNRTDPSVFSRLQGAKILLLNTDRQIVSAHTIDLASQKPFTTQVAPSFPITWKQALADFSQPQFPPLHSIDGKIDTGWAVGGDLASAHSLRLVPQLPPNLPISSENQSWQLRLHLACQSKFPKHVLARFLVRWSTQPHAASQAPVPPPILDLARTPQTSRTPSDQIRLTQYFQHHIAPSLQATRDQLAQLRLQLDSLKPSTSVPILRDLPPDQQRPTFVHLRGNYKAQGDHVTAAVPTGFHPLRSNLSSPPTRLELAQWLVQPDNPLTHRVLANRLWEAFFGIGLVRTSEEFGSQGDLPTHPELLDHLALDLLDQQWDLKNVIRKIVTSSTYRQSSQSHRHGLETDPENLYLWRGPRFRLSAEEVRDQALALSGLLSRKMFGEPVRPPQPTSGLSAAFGSKTDWEPSAGEDRYRRALYTVWRRSNPYPSMATFDAPNREVCTLRRDRTNTPLQALVTLNDPVYVEAAQALARRITLEHLPNASSLDQLQYAFRLTTLRHPTDQERNYLQALLERAKIEFASSPDQAKLMATDPLGPLPDHSDPISLAAWTVVCNALLNLDELLMSR